MPYKKINIPKEEQLKAISNGNVETYNMLKKYIGDLNKAENLRSYITITEAELTEYLRSRPELMEKFLYKEGTARHHEEVILEYNGIKYRVYQMDHDEPWGIQEFEDLAKATANYLISNLGI